MEFRKLPMVLLALTFLNLAAFLAAPYTIPPGTVRNLDGNANMVDYGDLWAELPLLPRIVYTVGDFNCHQRADRSFHLNGNQMPMCARCAGLNVGFFLGSLALMMTIPSGDIFRSSLTPILGKRAITMERKYAIALSLGMGFIVLAPMVLDGLVQALTDYESTNAMRLVTGTVFGAALVYALGIYMESMLFEPGTGKP